MKNSLAKPRSVGAWTLWLRLFAWAKLPLLGFVNPRIVENSEKRVVVLVKRGYRTRNHLNVMYFGALAIGAELSVAFKAVESIDKSKKKIDFLFKDFSCEFLRRADDDVHFICDEAQFVDELIQNSIQTTNRLEKKFTGYAVTISDPLLPIMKYSLTLSVKNRSKL
jgi:hypothetical protein